MIKFNNKLRLSSVTSVQFIGEIRFLESKKSRILPYESCIVDKVVFTGENQEYVLCKVYMKYTDYIILKKEEPIDIDLMVFTLYEGVQLGSLTNQIFIDKNEIVNCLSSITYPSHYVFIKKYEWVADCMVRMNYLSFMFGLKFYVLIASTLLGLIGIGIAREDIRLIEKTLSTLLIVPPLVFIMWFFGGDFTEKLFNPFYHLRECKRIFNIKPTKVIKL